MRLGRILTLFLNQVNESMVSPGDALEALSRSALSAIAGEVEGSTPYADAGLARGSVFLMEVVRCVKSMSSRLGPECVALCTPIALLRLTWAGPIQTRQGSFFSAEIAS